MLTLGYADVTPLRAPATTLSLLTGFFGLFYTAEIALFILNSAPAMLLCAACDGVGAVLRT